MAQPLMFNKTQPGDEGIAEEEQAKLDSGHRLLVMNDNQDAADGLMFRRLQGYQVREAFRGGRSGKGKPPPAWCSSISECPGMNAY